MRQTLPGCCANGASGVNQSVTSHFSYDDAAGST